MARKCKEICKNEYLYGIKVFSKKRLPYNKASYCEECNKSVIPASVDKIVVTDAEGRQEFVYKIKVTCPCCKTICRGKPHTKPKPKPKPEYLKSYKELRLKKTPTRFTSESKKQVNYWLERFEKYDYERKLFILKQYDKTGFENSNYSWPYNTDLDNFVQLLLYRLNNDKQRERYVRKFLNLLDKFARKNKLGLGALTEEEEKIESKKILYESIRRDADVEARGEYVPVVDIITDDKEDETKTNNVNGY